MLYRFAWIVLTIVVIGSVYGNDNRSQTVRKGNGAVMGYIESNGGKTTVRDANQRIIGYADQSGTYNAGNLKIADSYLPGYLFCSGAR